LSYHQNNFLIKKEIFFGYGYRNENEGVWGTPIGEEAIALKFSNGSQEVCQTYEWETLTRRGGWLANDKV
jgi:hypothetical protein